MTEILTVRNLKKYFSVNQSGVLRKRHDLLRAVDSISFDVREGECLGLVGESGSGKSTTAYMVVGMYPPTDGEILFRGENIGRDATKRPKSAKQGISIVFQDPGTSLNPRHTIRQILSVPLRVHNIVERPHLTEKIEELLRLVELPPEYMYKQPRAIGGGERQMVAVARALAAKPSLVVLDEPTSALDVSVQAKVITKLMEFQSDLGLSYLFITHDLSLMRNVATRIAIMYLGKIEELAPAVDFFQNPLHPYTKMLLSSIPVVTKAEEEVRKQQILSSGEIPSPVNVPPGCGFQSRCRDATDICLEQDPEMVEASEGHFVRCHLCF
jgi:oligopeptide/dipeptide ABC transporter ATP-binding protein